MSSNTDKDCIILLLTRHLERLLVGIYSSNKRTTLKEANAILDRTDFYSKALTTSQQRGGCHRICLMAASGDELRSDLASWIANSTMAKAITL
ncbi:hypothetical protein JMJ77_0009803 [Colletotrichum scovillei]|uniref:Uncharacterized protein n=1 Tax=Colletotrichum scovillei TaxID=1209932 RepID=A0A9P7R2N7_9PEZI|nr:hypothetical protein JMJ77_0009803 [Colletotrichum scovillei]KAG7052888.1 hypothetical protein JMJ78_0005898 [Colletotrichum scovillei]KAG7065179.1 hypothetical protein JMJ76_0012930 [Colletotrichum scovillei]